MSFKDFFYDVASTVAAWCLLYSLGVYEHVHRLRRGLR